MEKTDKIIIAMSVLILIGVYAYARKTGKNKGRVYIQPDTDFIDPGLDVEGFALGLIDAIKGLDWTWKKANLFEKYYNLNSNEMITVYNKYNEIRYPNQPEKSLYKDIQNEWIWGAGKTRLLEKMESLNLT